METNSQIKNNLKKLRLHAVLENIEQRTKDAIDTHMSYIDYLLILMQDEVDRREQNRKKLAIKKAMLGRYKRITDFDFNFNPHINRQKIMNLLSCTFISKSENVIFEGPTGVGKTFLSKAIAHEACCRGYKVLFTRTEKMLDTIYSGKADGSYQKKLNMYIKPDILVLDDWGMTAFTNQYLNILNEIISERYENGSIIITSNRPIENWDELFSEPVISSALIDRLFHNSHIMKIPGKSYRRRLK
ncbi:MAG: IS21-like element helper ATPase IstB [Calditrichaeota bacterium]|nr:IS21-like element helper ATPase IstB [Calditrichota bacterium]